MPATPDYRALLDIALAEARSRPGRARHPDRRRVAMLGKWIVLNPDVWNEDIGED